MDNGECHPLLEICYIVVSDTSMECFTKLLSLIDNNNKYYLCL